MAALRVLCWALIFILRLRFPPGSSIATTKRMTGYRLFSPLNLELFLSNTQETYLEKFTCYKGNSLTIRA